MKGTLRPLRQLIRWTILTVCCAFALSGSGHFSALSQYRSNLVRQSRDYQSHIFGAKIANPIQRLKLASENPIDEVSFDFSVLSLPQAGSAKIAFTSNRDGSMQIYLMNTDGSGQTRLTDSGANDDNPRWSPNGSKILFQSDRDHPDTGSVDIYVMNADGSGITRLTTDANDDSMAAWSPGGTKVVFQSMRNGVNYQVYSMNADGSNQVNLTNTSSSDGQPSCSPDGSKVVFARDRDHAGFDSVYVMNIDGANQQRITFGSGTVEDTQPMWSPDGGKIAFVSTRDSTTETWQETDDDGNYITKSSVHINKEIYVMNSDGSGQTRLTNDLANDDAPSLSPDGSKIVFRSDRERDCCDPSAQVWTMNADGTGQVNISNSGNGDYSASWTSTDFVASPLAGSYTGNQPPVANAGGPYIAQSGQVVQLNGGGSFDPNGTIVSYSWNFGDGTTGAGPIVNHQYDTSGVYSLSLSVSDNNGNSASSQGFVTVDSVAFPVKINFDELPNNTIVADQYLSKYGVRFYSDNNFSPLHTWQNCGFCSSTSLPNYIWTYPNITGPTFVEFTQPASNLTFYIIGISVFFDQFAILDVYRNNSLYGSFQVFGNGTTTRQVSLGSLDNINKIVIRGITDPDGVGFDDFTFNVPADVKITSGRISGYLNGTTQNALLGADVALQASPLPGGFAGGTYAWTCSPSTLCPISTAVNSPSVTLRTNEVGTYTATVTYTKNGLTATGSVTIKSILPTLTSFTVPHRSTDRINSPGTCGHTLGPDSLFWWYDLGCKPSSVGMSFSSNIDVPTFLSDPAQSGVKYVQAVNTFRKKVSGGMRCDTRRSTETDVSSGWQLDTSDPYKRGLGELQYFTIIGSPGFANGFSVGVDDYPGRAVTGFVDYDFLDSLYIDERFQMYIVYFTGPNPSLPLLQRPLGMMEWNWGGTVVFDDPGYHHLRSSNAPYQIAHIFDPPHQNMSSMVTMDGNVTDNQDHRCPGGPELTNNLIDSSRVFVRVHYIDFLGRDPDGNPNDPNDPNHPTDLPGWKFWTSQISKCAFDLNCIHAQRVNDGLAFFLSGEFIGTDPDLANPPGSPGFNPAVYNRAFVKYCYLKYLHRNPVLDPEGWDFWTKDLNINGSYAHMIDAFISCADYRDNRHDFTTVAEKF